MEQPGAGHLTRRRFLAVAGLGLAATATGLSGCGQDSGPVSRVPHEVLRVAIPRLQDPLDPHDWADATGPRTFAPMFDALTFVEEDGKLRPALALAWERLTPTAWQFRIRVSDAKFHNGEWFGVESVKLTLERLIQPGAALALSPQVAHVSGVEVVDPATVIIHTSKPDADLPRLLSEVYLLPAGYFKEVGRLGFSQRPVGTGFWAFDSSVPGQRLTMRLFRDNWRRARGSDPPPLRQLELLAIPDGGARVALLRQLEVDIITELTTDQADELQSAGFAILSKNGRVAAASNVQDITALPDGSWWFDRVTKSDLQRLARRGGA